MECQTRLFRSGGAGLLPLSLVVRMPTVGFVFVAFVIGAVLGALLTAWAIAEHQMQEYPERIKALLEKR